MLDGPLMVAAWLAANVAIAAWIMGRAAYQLARRTDIN